MLWIIYEDEVEASALSGAEWRKWDKLKEVVELDARSQEFIKKLEKWFYGLFKVWLHMLERLHINWNFYQPQDSTQYFMCLFVRDSDARASFASCGNETSLASRGMHLGVN